MAETYKARILCTNCRSTKEINIPRGRSIAEWLKEHKPTCEICGLKTRSQTTLSDKSVFMPFPKGEVEIKR